MPYRRIHHDSRHPYEIVVVIWALFYSFFAITSSTFPGAVQLALNSTYRYLWSVTLFIGSLFVLLSILWRKANTTSAALETVGMFFVGVGFFVYGITIFADYKVGSLLAGGFFCLIGCASFWRAFVIRREIRRGPVVITLEGEGRP